MAEQSEDRSRDDLSEEPSQHRIEDFRRKGKVVQSRELSGMIALLACGLTLYVMTPSMMSGFMDFMRQIFEVDLIGTADFTQAGALKSISQRVLRILIVVAAPIFVVALISGIVGSFSQVGSIFSTDPLKPDVNRINPIEGIKKFFALKQVYDGIRLVFKGLVVALIAYYFVKKELAFSPQALFLDPAVSLSLFGDSGKVIFISLCAALLVFAGFDFWIQRWDYGKNIRLTKQEAKQEHKEHEGDPLIKARIRSIQRETARKRMMDAVKTADVIVTNPTHIAVALSYDREKMNAPKVVAKGADFLAQKIKKIAADAGVPLVENVPLARTLYASVKVGKIIPRNLYQAVAEVLAHVYKLKGRMKG